MLPHDNDLKGVMEAAKMSLEVLKKNLIDQVQKLDPNNGWSKPEKLQQKASLLLISKNTGARGVIWFVANDICLAYRKKVLNSKNEVEERITAFSWRPIWNINHGPMPESLKDFVIGWCELSKSAKSVWLT